MNGLFGLRMQFVVGERMLVGIATGTGAFLGPLPVPPVPRLLGAVTSEEENVALQELQLRVREQLAMYKDLYQLNVLVCSQSRTQVQAIFINGEIIFILWTFSFVFWVSRAIREFKFLPEYLFTWIILRIIWNPGFQV